MATIKCTKGARHKWDWVQDRTFKSGSFGPSGARMHLSRKGIYKCECGALKYGEPRSGL
jgi:hypothetical protein